MSEPPRGVPAAPNRSIVEAKVLSVRQSDRFPDRWELDLEVVSARAVEGGSFARPGDRVRGFTFAESLDLAPASTIVTDAEFVGDERGGAFRLTNPRPSRG